MFLSTWKGPHFLFVPKEAIVISKCAPQGITCTLATGGRKKRRPKNREAHLKHYQVIIMSLDLKQISQSHHSSLEIRIIHCKKITIKTKDSLTGCRRQLASWFHSTRLPSSVQATQAQQQAPSHCSSNRRVALSLAQGWSLHKVIKDTKQWKCATRLCNRVVEPHLSTNVLCFQRGVHYICPTTKETSVKVLKLKPIVKIFSFRNLSFSACWLGVGPAPAVFLYKE